MKRQTKLRAMVGIGVILGTVVWSARRRQRRIDIVDTTAPDAFGSAVVREEDVGAVGMD